jgi:ribosomal protein L11 methyltransferase
VRRLSVWVPRGKARSARTKRRAALQAARLRGVIDGARLEEEAAGMAFGTGQHPSTRLAIELAQRHIQANGTLLDIGCGSGIVGLTAALRGMRVYASDSDGVAVGAACKNFARNHLRAKQIVKARDVPARFPQSKLVIANITARVLERLATQFTAKLKPAGVLVTSGIVEAGKDRLLQAREHAGLKHLESAGCGEWLAFAHVKPGRPMRRRRPR